MPRIDPNQLLKCLSALLGTNGGIKSSMEVNRIAALMTKFSKKLVSKCIYIQILKSTQSELLVEFMAEGGWSLVFQWLDDAIVNNNYPLIREILELLLLCPISLDRLKENNCPKVVKGLSKDSEDELVKQLAGKLVEQWLKFIKSGQAAISDVAMAAAAAEEALGPKRAPITSPKTAVVKPLPTTPSNETVKKVPVIRKLNKIRVSQGDEKTSSDEEVPPIGSLPLYKITVRDGKSVLAKVGTKTLTITTKKPESESDTVTGIILKSEAGSKKFRYVPKSIAEKDKSEVSEITSDDSSSRDKLESAHSKIGAADKRESKITSDESSESSERDKSKSSSNSSSKSSRDNKLKDSSSKSKTHKDRDKERSESRHKENRDRKESSKESDKDRRKSDHKSHKSDKDRERDRDRDKSKHKDSSSKDKYKESEKSKDKDKKLLTSAEKAQIQADKDKDTLERLKTPAISSLGKIPKKSSSQNGNSSSSSASASKSNSTSKSSDSPHFGSDKSNSDKKSGEVKKVEIKGPKPKTVKTFNSKFRSTGLEEEIKPPPSRSSIKKKIEEKKPVLPVIKPEVSALKHPSPSPKDGSPPEKKSKIAEVIAEKKDKIVDKPGGIKLIPPKPKPALLESDMFSDALTASTKLEPRKRKRRTSGSKDGPDIKKEQKEESASGATSPKDVKPNLKFYRDTLEDDEEKNKENTDIKTEIKMESDSEESKQTGDGEDTPISKLFPNGVLLHKTKKGPKKSVKWKEESDLITVKYFELDETERVNVTRNFVDMKLLERNNEREAFQLARKLASEDIMEEKIPWGPLHEVDIPPERRPAVEPGRASEEKNVQYAREKTVLQAIYFHRSSIPDSPAEPDPESHPTTDPKIIPLEDITGNADSVSNFTNMPWPEPKPTLIPSSPPPVQPVAPTPAAVAFPAGYSTVGNFAGFPAMGMPGVMPTGQGTWRTGDGKDMQMPMAFPANGPLCPPPMAQPNMYPPDGFNMNNMNGPGMAPGFNPAFGMGCDPSMYGPPPPMGGMNPGGPPPQWNRGGWGQGPRGPCPPMNMPPKFPKGVCHHFAKFGNCQRGNSCRFMHPGVNCPPLT